MNKKIIPIVAIIFLIIVGVIGVKIIRPEKPALEEAKLILAESMQNMLALTSYTMTGGGNIQYKDGEVVILGITVDGQSSIINPFDFINQDSGSAFTLNIAINFAAITNLIEAKTPPEELEGLKNLGGMGIDLLEIFRLIDETNISTTVETKSIDFDTYVKIAEIKGLKEVITQVGGAFVADMIMTKIEPFIGVWHKTPADPAIAEETTAMFEKGLIPAAFDVYYVKEVLSNTEVNGTPVYNFVLGMDLDKIKNVVISFVPLFVEEAEMDIEEKERIIVGINKKWPEIKKVIEAMEMDFRTYICQRTRHTIKETGTVNIDLYEVMTVIAPIMRTKMTPEELVEFNEMKETIKNINFVATVGVVYSDHNAVPAIMPPEEYEEMPIPGIPGVPGMPRLEF